jgi:hypothetical protein
MLDCYCRAFDERASLWNSNQRNVMRVMSSLPKSKCEEGMQKSKKSNVHLFKLKISRFSGTIPDCYQHCDGFDAVIYKYKELCEVQKLRFIMSFLTGATKNVLADIKISN